VVVTLSGELNNRGNIRFQLETRESRSWSITTTPWRGARSCRQHQIHKTAL